MDIVEIAGLADRGRLAEAEEQCARYLRSYGPSAEAFHLLGLICDAAGRPAEADTCYRKALYLEPKHQDALQHLILLHERQGDVAALQVLKQRLQRLSRQDEH
jgi:chemotaxis protein methyltransferase WspC